MNVVFESPGKWHRPIIDWYLFWGANVYVTEDFYAFHLNFKGRKFFPRKVQPYINRYLEIGKIKLIPASKLNSYHSHLDINNRIVEKGEQFFSEYLKHLSEIISLAQSITGLKEVDLVYRKDFMDRLGCYYSIFDMTNCIQVYLNKEPFVFWTSLNSQEFLFFHKKIIKKFDLGSCRFSRLELVIDALQQWGRTVLMSFFLLLQIFWNIPYIFKKDNKDKQFFKYGFTILSSRQLRNKYRRADFLVDNGDLKKKDCCFFLLYSGDESDQALEFKREYPSTFLLPKLGRFISDPVFWMKGFLGSLKHVLLLRGQEIYLLGLILFTYSRWNALFSQIEIKHFVTHGDFGLTAIVRNAMIRKAGGETWYFTDSMNSGYVRSYALDTLINKHFFWCYLNYDHYVTWTKVMGLYFQQHPKTVQRFHVVGCLWADQIQQPYSENHVFFKTAKIKIVVCDSSYTLNGITPFEEGIAFAKDILKLAQDCEDIEIILKQKKHAAYHLDSSPKFGKVLVDLYEEMKKNDRISVLNKAVNLAQIIHEADLTISFPFTSPTFEALCADKQALWHDAESLYNNTLYSQRQGFVTHGYASLLKVVDAIRSGKFYQDVDGLAEDGLIDSYRDGDAKSRFRDLLINNVGVLRS